MVDVGNVSLARCARRILYVGVAGMLTLFSACPPPPPEARTALPLVVGIEYAVPGMAAAASPTRLPGVKFLPDLYAWERMQPTETSPINFAMLDRLVSTYQERGLAECMLGLKSESPWAAVDPPGLIPSTNPSPKPEFMDDYAAWVRAVVERYDGDGFNDMPGLLRPIRYYEIGVEFSSFEPEPVEDYLEMLETAYDAAHAAFGAVIVLHAAFLPTTAFDCAPGPEEYELAFAAANERIMYHTLDDIRTVLDRPDLFDAVNFHALASPLEIEEIVAWLRYEMNQRDYDKPLVISDTSPNPLIAWGPATLCDAPPNNMGLVLRPAVEADRCRLADFFTLLVAGDVAALDWTYAIVAEDAVKKVIVAADQRIAFINTAFMEDFTPLQAPFLQAGAGIGAWGGIADVAINVLTQERTAGTLRPLYYALRQMANHLDGFESIVREPSVDPRVRMYTAHDAGSVGREIRIAWFEPDALILPEDEVPSMAVEVEVSGFPIRWERLITQSGQTKPESGTLPVVNGRIVVTLTPTPIFLLPQA